MMIMLGVCLLLGIMLGGAVEGSPDAVNLIEIEGDIDDLQMMQLRGGGGGGEVMLLCVAR